MTQPAATTLRDLGSSLERGLPSATATARLAADGANDVPEEKSHPLLRFARKFWGLSAWMIELIALLSFILHKNADLAVALALLVVNAILSFLEEQKASQTVPGAAVRTACAELQPKRDSRSATCLACSRRALALAGRSSRIMQEIIS